MMESGARYNDMSVTVVMAHQKARNCVMYVLGLYDLSFVTGPPTCLYYSETRASMQSDPSGHVRVHTCR